MGDGREDNIVTGESNETGDVESEPVRLIPEGFEIDNTLPSIVLEDFEGDNDVWLIDIPASVDPKRLYGQQLDFRQDTSFVIDEQSNERCISLPSREPCSVICLLSSHHENSKKIVALKPAGKISININYDVPEFGSMIPESKNVKLPEGLKVRHPFLGPKYKDIVKSMEELKEKTVASGNILPVKNVTPQEKNISVPGEILNVAKVKDEILSPKKSKKRKRESLHEDRNADSVKHFDVDPVHLRKKLKREEKKGFPEKERSSEAMEISTEEGVREKKGRKEKKRASEIIATEVNAATLQEVDDTTNYSLSVQKKKKKKKKDPQWSGEEGEMLDVSLVKSPKKEKKEKKRDSVYVSEAGPSDVLSNDMMYGELSRQTLDRLKEARNELKKNQYERVMEGSDKEGNIIQEVVYSEPRIKKEKSKKRRTVDNVEVEAASLNFSAVHMKPEWKTEENIESAEKKLDSERIEVLNVESSHVKKRKKDKKRASERVNIELDMETLKEEADVIPNTPGQTPKKKKKKIKEEAECSIEEERVADVSMVEPSVPLEVGEETPKKAKKKKKRDSEPGSGAGEGGMLSDITEVKELPDPRSKRVKQIKKEIKQQLDKSILEVFCEEVAAEPRKSKKRLTVDMVGMEMVNVDSQDSSVTSESKGITSKKKKKKNKEEPECGIKEERVADVSVVELSVPLEVGEEIPKKAKKKKKRNSEFESETVQGGVLSEDVVEAEEMPGHESEVVGKSKKEKWYIDCNPSTYNNFKNSPDGKRIKKACDEAFSNAQHEGENPLYAVNNIMSSDSKKWKRRHTMDIAGIASVSTDPNRVHLLPEVKIEGKSQHKKRKSLLTQEFGAQLLSPKKEKKIKKESIG